MKLIVPRRVITEVAYELTLGPDLPPSQYDGAEPTPQRIERWNKAIAELENVTFDQIHFDDGQPCIHIRHRGADCVVRATPTEPGLLLTLMFHPDTPEALLPEPQWYMDIVPALYEIASAMFG